MFISLLFKMVDIMYRIFLFCQIWLFWPSTGQAYNQVTGADLVGIYGYRGIENDETHTYYHHVNDISRNHRVRRNASLSGMTDFTVTELLNISLSTTLSPQSLTDLPIADDMQITNTDVPELESTSFFPDNSSSNFTILEDEDHRYYRSRVISTLNNNDSLSYWVSEQTMYKAETHGTLSESYRSAVTVPLSFTFVFYGHEVKQITIATGGFLYMSDFLHQWLTATQYVAPLMANFDTQLGNNSYIRYMDNGTVFVVWWEDAYLQDFHEVGPFSFQAMLCKDGRIVFSYKQVPPITVLKIPTARHPVKVGLSDAYYVDKPANSEMRQRTIYEYHRVEINMTQISSNATVIITPVDTCSTKKSCTECIEASSSIPFQCQWCPIVGRCSDGLDRRRQEWQEKSCDKSIIINVDQCQFASLIQSRMARLSLKNSTTVTDASIVGVVLLTFIAVLVFVVAAWLVYAYRNPNSQSGIWLIQHRPSSIVERVRQLVTRRSSRGANKYEVAMHPEAESLA